MEKAIIILDGVSDGKTKFTDLVRIAQYWSWNINFKNSLTKVTKSFFWDNKRDQRFYDFLEELTVLTNKYFNFEESYTRFQLENFENNDRVNLLIIHNCNNSIRDFLMKDYSNCYHVVITEEDLNTVSSDRYFWINHKDSLFEDKTKDILKTITTNKEN